MTEQEKSLLLVEDNDDHAAMTEFYIQDCREDLHIQRIRDGAEAMQYLDELESSRQALPWIVLLDLKLPKYDGHEILARMKASTKLAKIPVVIFSTSNSAKDIEQALSHQANSYIVKPMEADKYGEVIGDILRYWHLNQHHLLACYGNA
jgi:CheY-like chemotaxis protein